MTTVAVENGDGVRVIGGRRIERQSCVDKFTGDRFWRFQDIERPAPIERESYNELTGDRLLVLEHATPILRWSSESPGEQWQEQWTRLASVSRDPHHPALAKFDPREPSPLHDQLERAKAAGFGELAELAQANLKIEDRVPFLRGHFPVGECWCRQPGTFDAATIRHFLGKHVKQDLVEPSEDDAWCPPRAGVDVENAVAIESGHGLIRSRFEIPIPEIRGGIFPVATGRMTSIYLNVWTLLVSNNPGKTQTLIF
jgi:hypothetical protein